MLASKINIKRIVLVLTTIWIFESLRGNAAVNHNLGRRVFAGCFLFFPQKKKIFMN